MGKPGDSLGFCAAAFFCVAATAVYPESSADNAMERGIYGLRENLVAFLKRFLLLPLLLLPLVSAAQREDFDPSASVINFIVIEDRVRFDIALKPAKRSNLRISSRLLSVARHVIDGTS